MKPRYQSIQNQNTDQIRAGIEQTRAEMDDTMDELSERLKPRHLLDDVLDYFHSRHEHAAGDGEKVKQVAGQARESAAQAGRAIIRQAKAHPIPTVLIGAGLAWLLLEGDDEEERTDRSYSYEASDDGQAEGDDGGKMQGLKDKGAELKTKAGETIARAKDRVSDKGHEWSERAGEMSREWKHSAQDAYHRSADSFKRATDDYPLAVGAGCLALGVIAGLLLPSTRKEDELVGPTRDRLVSRGREVAQEAMERGKQVGEAALQAAKDEAQQQGITPEAIKEKTTHVFEVAKSTAQNETQHQTQEFKAKVG